MSKENSPSNFDPAAAFTTQSHPDNAPNGKEPLLGGKLIEKAVWVDESLCIGCRYCANVAPNTFVMEPYMGRSRALRQDGDAIQTIQEAIDTCPVDCIQWVRFEDLGALQAQLAELELQPLGMLPKISRRRKSK